MSHAFKRILIANRGEIALRVIRACRELGIESVAVYSDADAQSSHRFKADHAVRLPGETSADSYLNLAKLQHALHVSGADAVHPGYGFLSESPQLVDMVSQMGKIFIGPDRQALEVMGHKVKARELMREHGVPVVPGSKAPIKEMKELQQTVRDIGLPVILKAAAGGGGRGMRVVTKDTDLGDAFKACQREALAYFGSDEVFCERYIEQPRHIEFQVLADQHGHTVHLFERDCSIQRRHQKIIEEAPSAYLTPKSREKLGEIACRAAQAVGYRGAGTVEFICESPDQAYFMEMNTRIQVEHPVTEMITGVDLIKWQIRVAQNEPLAFKQEDLSIRGWSIEARINAEDPDRDFTPCPGSIQKVFWPQGPGVRIDSHIYDGYTIPSQYDSMIAKLIVHAEDRESCLLRLKRALGECRIDGILTTIPFHERLIEHQDFKAADFSTRFLEENAAYFSAKQDLPQDRPVDERTALLSLAATLNRSTSRESTAPTNRCSTQDERRQWERASLQEQVDQ